MSMERIQYDTAKAEIKQIPIEASIKDYIDEAKVNWFNITGISDSTQVTRICKELGLHGFDIKDLLAGHQVVKAIAYHDVTFILMSAFYPAKGTDEIDDINVAFILGQNFVVSFCEESAPIFDEIKENIVEKNSLIRQKGVDFLLYILLNTVNTCNINTVISIEDKLAEIEDQLIERENSTDTLKYLHSCKVNHMHIKRAVTALREEYSNILHNTNQLIKEENIIYFNNFDDHMRTLQGDLLSLYESLSSLLELYYNNINLKMNEIIKRLTIVSTIFIPLTFMVGVWGMNFRLMPETDWEYGYAFAWITFVVIAVLSYLWIRKQKWF